MTITETPFADRVKNIPESFIREILKVAARPDMISFAGGLPHPAFFPVEKLALAAEKVLSKDGKIALQYAPTEGYLPLREYIAERESKKSEVHISAEDVLMLNGSQQGLDLAGKLFINTGSPLVLEAPSYLGAIQAFSTYRPRFLEIDLEDGGPNLDQLTIHLRDHNPSLFYCIPNYQNPTGNTYDYEHRIGIQQSFRDSNAIIVEDNPYGDIYFEHLNLPDIHSLLPERTVKLGSFSKIISPGLRLGWAIAPQEILKKMTIIKQASDLHSSNFGQRVLYQFLLDNSFEYHLAGIREFYKSQAVMMSRFLKQYFPKEVKWTEAKGGMFLWITLPSDVDSSSLLKRAITEGVLFVPGEHFFINANQGKNTIRMNFSNASEQQMMNGLSIMGRLLYETIPRTR